jgi:hypothetical protein
MFALDRDLLALEPYLFRDHAWVGQRLTRGIGSVSDGLITMDSSDVEFDVAQVAIGCVATYLGASFEIIGGITTKHAAVSRVRASVTGATIHVEDTGLVDIAIVSFRPQITLVHRQVLRMAGIEPDAPAPAAGRLGESAVTNGAALVTLEALGALHLIFAAAASVAGPSSPAMARAQMYRELFREERRRVVVELDTDGDGRPDVERRLNVVQFVRA